MDENLFLRRSVTEFINRETLSPSNRPYSPIFRSQSLINGKPCSRSYRLLSRRFSFIPGRNVSITLSCSNALENDKYTSSNSEEFKFEDFPEYCIMRIMAELSDVQEWLNYKLVCKKWNYLANLALIGLKVREISSFKLVNMLQMLHHFPHLTSLQISTSSRELIDGKLFTDIGNACSELKSLHIVYKGDLNERNTQFQISSLSFDSLFSILSQLEELTIAFCELNGERMPELFIPSSLGNMSKLKSLALHIPSLVSLPESIGKLSELKELDIDSQALTLLPDSIELLESLSSLTLSHCSSLESLPETLGSLSRLTNLNLKDCSSLARLPGTISTLTDLNRLILQNCSNLTEIPRTIGCLRNLTELDLQGCSGIVQLPRSINRLKKLTLLDLLGCRLLKTLPKFLLELPSLTMFAVDESPKFENCKKTGFDSSMIDEEDDVVFKNFEFAR